MWPCKPCGNAHFLTCQKLQTQLDLASLLQENRRVEQFSFRKWCGGGPTSNGFPIHLLFILEREEGQWEHIFLKEFFILSLFLPIYHPWQKLTFLEVQKTQFRLPTSYPFSAIGHSRKSGRELGFESSQSRNEKCLCCIRAPLSLTAPPQPCKSKPRPKNWRKEGEKFKNSRAQLL